MLDTNNTDGQKSEDQQQLSVSNRAAHDEQYPFLSEFSELVAKLSTEDLLELTTINKSNLLKPYGRLAIMADHVLNVKRDLKKFMDLNGINLPQ